MLVRFHSKAGGISMLGDTARALLRHMGQSGEVPGALLAPDLPGAVERLKLAVADLKSARKNAADPYGGEQRVSLATHAFPLIEFLERSVRHDTDVIWEEQAKSTG